ncbi:MAG: hypothetical protein R3E39_17420 [Anaerolineae bacterium]
MTIQVGWDSSQRNIIHIIIERGWTWDEFEQAIQQADNLIVSVSHVVHLVVDIQQAGGLPRDWMGRAGQLFAQGEARSNEGYKVVVGAGWLIRTAYQSFAAVFAQDRPFHFAATYDEALQMIALADIPRPDR